MDYRCRTETVEKILQRIMLLEVLFELFAST